MSFSLAINLPETERLDIASFVVGSNKSLASQVGYGGGGGGNRGDGIEIDAEFWPTRLLRSNLTMFRPR